MQAVARIRNEKFIKAFGQRVREARTSKGMSMEQLADLAGIDYQQVLRVEQGKVNATISTAYHIAGALEVPFSTLFDL